MKKVECIHETLKHIRKVGTLMVQIINRAFERALVHDDSKLREPELTLFNRYTPKLKLTDYGSEEYYDILKKMAPALKYHYTSNSHHPEHYEKGIKDMNLVDILEMLCDWMASSERHDTGDIYKSLEHNQTRFGYSDDVKAILWNTIKYMGW